MANLGDDLGADGAGGRDFRDRLNHASIYDGIKLSGADLQRFPHRDLDRLDTMLEGRVRLSGGDLVITDSVFSVDGDVAPLAELAALKARYGAWLMIDEAHATGVLGDEGRRAWPRP